MWVIRLGGGQLTFVVVVLANTVDRTFHLLGVLAWYHSNPGTSPPKTQHPITAVTANANPPSARARRFHCFREANSAAPASSTALSRATCFVHLSPLKTRLRDVSQVRAGVFGALDGGSAEFACTTSCSHGHTPCEVCHLLTRDQPATPAAPPRWQKRVD